MQEPAAPAPGRVGQALPQGTRLEEYVVDQALGGGGFGVTYLAKDVNLGVAVAVKEYFPADISYRADDGSIQALSPSTQSKFQWGLDKFIDEARALATFKHPHIVRVLRYFKAKGTAYIVMEYESGYSLKQWYTTHLPVTRAMLMKLVLPLLDGLEMIHRAKMLHRDIKPDNIYVRSDGGPVLIDFGSARSTLDGRELTTIVSPGYAPFEQYHSQGNQGPWNDLYSLAAVMYWMVTGTKPPEAAARLKLDLMVPAVRNADVREYGEDLLSAIDWALKPDEADRPQSVAQFRAKLLGTAYTETVPGGAVVSGSQVRYSPPDAPSQPMFPNEAAKLDASQRSLVGSVLSMGISGYFDKTPQQQQEAKTHFSQVISAGLSQVADQDCIGVEKADGAGICFTGDPEAALAVALDISRSLPGSALALRMGLHLGPVRIFSDPKGHVAVVGDGINTAQRIMACASDNSLVTSQPFYDVVSYLSDNSGYSFRHLGVKTDAMGRAHELYEVTLQPGADDTRQLTPTSSRSQSHAYSQTRMATVADAELQAMERQLVQWMGPIASVLVQKARKRSADAQVLRQMLSQHIADPGQRASFLRAQPVVEPASATAAKSQSVRASAVHGATSPSPRSAPPPPAVPSRSQPNTATRSSLSPQLVAHLEKCLAQVVGPMAGFLVKREMATATDFNGLCQALARHIDEPPLRQQFLRAATTKPIK